MYLKTDSGIIQDILLVEEINNAPCVCPEVILHPFMRNVSLAAGLWALINDAHIVLDPSQINQAKTHNGITLSCFIHRLASIPAPCTYSITTTLSPAADQYQMCLSNET